MNITEEKIRRIFDHFRIIDNFSPIIIKCVIGAHLNGLDKVSSNEHPQYTFYEE